MNIAADFSNKEHEVINLLLQGKSNKQISAELKIRNRTVEFHLTNIYQKLGVGSRAEAIVRLTQSVPGHEHDLRESTVDFSAQNNDNQMKFLSGGAVVRKRLAFAAGGLILFAILVYFILFALFKPVPGNMLATDEVGFVVAQSLTAMPPADIPAAETAIQTGQITTVPSVLTFDQADGSTTYRLTVNWFYIDSTRAEFEYTVCGLPIPAGLDPVLIVHRSEMELKDHTGNRISVNDFGDFGAGDGRSPDPSDAQNSCFNQVDSYQILDA